MPENLKSMQKWFGLLTGLGKDPNSLASWDYEFFDPDPNKLRDLCGKLDANGYTFKKLRRDGGSISVHPGWVLTVEEVATHTPRSMVVVIDKFESLTKESGIELLCGYEMNRPPKRAKVRKPWGPLWDAAIAKLAAKQTQIAAAFPTCELDEFFKRATGGTGLFTSWLPFLSMPVNGSSVFLTDMRHGPTDDGLKVELEPGQYRVEFRGFVRGADRRCARLRAYREGSKPELGKSIGTVSTDLATLGFYDPKSFQPLKRRGSEQFFEWGESAFDTSKSSHGVLIHNLKKSAILPYVTSGFGDGTYPVFELTQQKRRIGFEVEFISEAAARQRAA